MQEPHNRMPAGNHKMSWSYLLIGLLALSVIGLIAVILSLTNDVDKLEQKNKQIFEQSQELREELQRNRKLLKENENMINEQKQDKQMYQWRLETAEKNLKDCSVKNEDIVKDYILLSENVTVSKYQLKSIKAQLEKERGDFLSHLAKEKSMIEEISAGRVEMAWLFSCIMKDADASFPGFGIFKRMFDSIIGNSKTDRCLQNFANRYKIRSITIEALQKFNVA